MEVTDAMEGVKTVKIRHAASGRKGRVQLKTPKRVLDITVLMGGPSSEHEVSLASGTAIADALVRNGHKVTRSDISPQELSALDRPGIDLVFIALHGDFGESGQVQRLCEARGLRYIGSGAAASELAMDKAAAKRAFAAGGISTPPGMVITEVTPAAKAWLEDIGLPIVLKPVDGGSSVDVVIAHDRQVRDRELTDLLAKYGRILAERFIEGKELTVGILGDEALPIIQIIPDGEFYDYRAKYSDGAKTQYIFEHGIDTPRAAAIQAMALAAHRSLGCRDMSRVDVMLEKSTGIPYVLEINTIPGFTSHSLLPKAAARVGIPLDQLVERIAEMAMARS